MLPETLCVRNGSHLSRSAWITRSRGPRRKRLSLLLMPKTKDHLQSVHIALTANCLDERGALTVVSPSQLHRLDAGGNLDYRLVALGGSAYITLERRR